MRDALRAARAVAAAPLLARFDSSLLMMLLLMPDAAAAAIRLPRFLDASMRAAARRYATPMPSRHCTCRAASAKRYAHVICWPRLRAARCRVERYAAVIRAHVVDAPRRQS